MYNDNLLMILSMQFTTNDIKTLLLGAYPLPYLFLLLSLYLSVFLPYVAFTLGHSLFKIPLISLLLQEPIDELKSATIELLTLLSIDVCPSSYYSLLKCSPCEHTLLRAY